MQLSSMSLGELAATLQLPPARLASMTLTELALRLAELNKMANEDGATEEPVAGGSKKDNSIDRVKHNHPYYPPDSEEEEEDEDEEEEEDEEEAVEIKVEEAEVCYKGGKKYEILSDIHQDPQNPERKSLVASSRPDAAKEGQVIPPSAASTSESDRYAALREIMQQDLAVTSGSPGVSTGFDDQFDDDSRESSSSGFARFEEATEANPSASVLGFEDDFSRIPLKRPDNTAAAYNLTGARPKTTRNNGVTPLPAEASGSSSAELFDPFGEDHHPKPSSSNSKLEMDTVDPEEEMIKEVPEDLLDEEDEAELVDKFAAFESRFPANPDDGFGDSFSDLSKKQADASASLNFTADFDSAFNGAPTATKTASSPPPVKKSTSVNIFKRVEDPFDDDFFLPGESTANGKSSTPPNAAATSTASKFITTIVEDPFAWVQPFDDGDPVVHFDDEPTNGFISNS